MDPRLNPVLLNITAFPGVQTNAPRGTQPAPDLLENVHLDRTGGYSPMPGRSRRLLNVDRALSASRADNLFVEQAGTVRYWDAGAGVLTDIPGLTTLRNAITLMPDLLLTPTGWVHRAGKVQTPAPIPGGKLTPRALTVEGSGVSSLAQDTVYDVLIQALPAPGAMYSGTVLYPNIGAGQSAPYHWTVTWLPTEQPPILRAYLRMGGGKFVYLGSNLRPDGRPVSSIVVRDENTAEPLGREAWKVTPAPTDDLIFTVTGSTPGTYHQGRVFLAPRSVSYTQIDGEMGPVVKTDTEPTRIYFSAVIADAKPDALPAFTLVNYLDAPFRVSRRVVALESVGPYLYIFGDRELLVMTGDPERDARVENIGDSIGAVNTYSVQQLSGVVYWLSDSGVLSVQGGQVREVGEPVRDQVLRLGPNIGSTVDFQRECYWLGDGVTTLCYHARENGWTSRELEGNGSASAVLIRGGGTPYLLNGITLYSLGGEVGLDGGPPRLPMRIRFPRYELGSWVTRKTFRGLACGLDLATQGATVRNLSTVDARTDMQADTAVTLTPGNTGVRLHLSRDGVQMTGVSLGIELEVETRDSRGILRPPLMVYGSQSGEEVWTDYGE